MAEHRSNLAPALRAHWSEREHRYYYFTVYTGTELMAKAHPGFAAVKSKIQGEGYSAKSAGAILASSTRKASAKAKKANPKLRKVKGK